MIETRKPASLDALQRRRTAGAADETPEARRLTAYRVNAARLPLVAAGPKRGWMDTGGARFVYRCLPIVMANQAGGSCSTIRKSPSPGRAATRWRTWW